MARKISGIKGLVHNSTYSSIQRYWISRSSEGIAKNARNPTTDGRKWRFQGLDTASSERKIFDVNNEIMERPIGIEPTPEPWQFCRLWNVNNLRGIFRST